MEFLSVLKFFFKILDDVKFLKMIEVLKIASEPKNFILEVKDVLYRF